MKKILVFIAAWMACSAYAHELKTFAEAAQAIEQEGKIPHVVIDAKACENAQQFGDSLASILPDAVMVIDGNRITGTHRHFTLDQPLMKGVPIFINSKFTISQDDNVLLKFTLMRASDYTKIKEMEINCQFGKGVRLFD